MNTFTFSETSVGLMLALLVALYLRIFSQIWETGATRTVSVFHLPVKSLFRFLAFWQMRFFSGLPLYTDLMDALTDSARTGKVLELTYRDASGAFHTRTVVLWQYDAERQIIRTREIGTNHFRQVIVAYVTSVRWTGDYSTATAPLQLNDDALTALSMLSPFAAVQIQ